MLVREKDLDFYNELYHADHKYIRKYRNSNGNWTYVYQDDKKTSKTTQDEWYEENSDDFFGGQSSKVEEEQDPLDPNNTIRKHYKKIGQFDRMVDNGKGFVEGIINSTKNWLDDLFKKKIN